MIYTALGDSITFGENASSFALAYPQLTVSILNSGSSCKAKGYVLARPGWSSHRLLDAVIWQGSSIISQSAVVSVWIGGVDLAKAALSSLKKRQQINPQQVITKYSRNLSGILTQIQRGSRARIVCCTQYNPFPNSPIAVEGIDLLNQTICEIARSYNVSIAPVHAWFEERQAGLIYGYRRGIIEDALSGSLPIHPNDHGHQIIAMGLAPYLFPHR